MVVEHIIYIITYEHIIIRLIQIPSLVRDFDLLSYIFNNELCHNCPEKEFPKYVKKN